MSTKKPRLWEPKPHRAVDWNPAAIQRCIDTNGFVYIEPKYDGIRCLIVYLENRWVATTREGIEITALADLLGYMKVKLDAVRHLVLDTEVFIEGLTFEESSGILRRDAALSVEHAASTRFALIDTVYRTIGLDSNWTMVHGISLRKRLSEHADCIQILSSCFLDLGEHRKRCSSLAEIEENYEKFRALGFEGAIIKDPELPYRNGKVSGWFKRKPKITVGGVVTGLRYGDAGKANAGKAVGFHVDLEDGSSCTATGLTQALIDYVSSNPDNYVGRAVEVTAMERTAGGKLRHPSFHRFRDMEGSEGVEA